MGEQITATGKERFEFALYLYTTKNMGIIQCAASFYQEKCKKYEAKILYSIQNNLIEGNEFFYGKEQALIMSDWITSEDLTDERREHSPRDYYPENYKYLINLEELNLSNNEKIFFSGIKSGCKDKLEQLIKNLEPLNIIKGGTNKNISSLPRYFREIINTNGKAKKAILKTRIIVKTNSF